MFRRSCLAYKADCWPKKSTPLSYAGHYYDRALSRWQQRSMGLNYHHHESRGRPSPAPWQFNPAFMGNTRGTKPEEAKKWWEYDREKLPQLPPDDYVAPTPIGRAAWPKVWTPEFASTVLSLTDADLREYALQLLTDALHEETQLDGYDLRRMDMEGRPMSEKPRREVVEHFILQEETLRDRIIERVVEEGFGFAPDSVARDNLRSVPNIIEYIVARMTTCREPMVGRITPAVQEFLAAQPVQPEFGFDLAVPQDNREQLLIEWEKRFHHENLFGKANFVPRDDEPNELSRTWLDMELEWDAREQHRRDVESGAARERHMAKIREAMGSTSNESSGASVTESE